jgi:hypothetical protein
MKESYSEVLARHAGPESYADQGNAVGVATAGVHAGPVLSSVIMFIPCAYTVEPVEGKIATCVIGKHGASTAESQTWSMCGNSMRENREVPPVCGKKSPAAVRELPRRQSGHAR